MIEARRMDTLAHPNLNSIGGRWAGIRLPVFLIVWLIIAALFGLGAVAILSLDADASDVTGVTAIAETNEAPVTLEISGFEDVVFGLGIPMETHPLMNRAGDLEFDAVVEYINRSCDDPDEMMPVSMCIA